MTLPATPAEITPGWLDVHLSADALGGRAVRTVTDEDIGVGTGIFGQIARLHLELDDGSTTSVVVKMPCLEPANLEVARVLGLYEREIAMFDEVVPRSPIESAACLASVSDDSGAFVLVLEDLSVEWQVGDQVIGATLDQAEAIVDVLAAFHAHWWEHPELDAMAWLPRPDAPQYVGAVPQIYRAGLPVLRSDWGDRVPAAAIDLATELEPRFEEILARTATGPETLIHTDTRLDNVFFARDGSGRVALIDFQLALRGRAVADVAYLIGTSVPRDVGREHWEALLRRWSDGVAERGVRLDWDDVVRQYREAALYYLSGPMSLIGTFDSGNERGAAMTEAYTTRMCHHVVDIDAGAVLRD